MYCIFSSFLTKHLKLVEIYLHILFNVYLHIRMLYNHLPNDILMGKHQFLQAANVGKLSKKKRNYSNFFLFFFFFFLSFFFSFFFFFFFAKVSINSFHNQVMTLKDQKHFYNQLKRSSLNFASNLMQILVN